MATANKHKQRSSRAYSQRDNFGRYFVTNVQKIRARNMFIDSMFNILSKNSTEEEREEK